MVVLVWTGAGGEQVEQSVVEVAGNLVTEQSGEVGDASLMLGLGGEGARATNVVSCREGSASAHTARRKSRSESVRTSVSRRHDSC